MPLSKRKTKTQNLSICALPFFVGESGWLVNVTLLATWQRHRRDRTRPGKKTVGRAGRCAGWKLCPFLALKTGEGFSGVHKETKRVTAENTCKPASWPGRISLWGVPFPTFYPSFDCESNGGGGCYSKYGRASLKHRHSHEHRLEVALQFGLTQRTTQVSGCDDHGRLPSKCLDWWFGGVSIFFPFTHTHKNQSFKSPVPSNPNSTPPTRGYVR